MPSFKRSAIKTAGIGCITTERRVRYAITIKPCRRLSAGTKKKPLWIGIRQNPHRISPKERIATKRTAPTTAAERKPAARYVYGRHGLVRTIFRLRLRRWDEI